MEEKNKTKVSNGPDKHSLMRRFLRLRVRLLLYPVAILVIILLAAVLFLQTDMARNKVKSLIEKAAEEYLQARLEVGKISGSLLFDFSLEQVRVSERGETLLTANRISANYLTPLLLKNILFFNEIQIEGVALRLVRKNDGRWNVATFMPRGKEKKISESRPVTIQAIVKRFSIRDAAVHITETRNGIPHTRHVNDIRFIAGLSLKPDAEIIARVMDFSFALDQSGVVLRSLNGRIGYVPQRRYLDLQNIRIRSKESDLTLNGAVDLNSAGIEFDVKSAIKSLSLPEIGGLFSIPALDRGVLNGSLYLKGRPDRFYHESSLKLEKLSVFSKGSIELSKTEPFGIDISAAILHLNPAVLPLKGLEGITADINADLTIKGSKLHRPERRGRLTIAFKPSQLAGYDLKDGKILATFDRKGLRLENSRLSGPLGRATVRSAVADIFDAARPGLLKLDASFENLDLPGLSGRPGLSGKINLDIKALANMPAKRRNGADTTNMTARVSADVQPSKVLGIAVDRGRLQAAWNGKQIEIDRLDLSTGVGRLALSGSLALQKRRGELMFDVIVPAFEKVAPLMVQLLPTRSPQLDNLSLAGDLKASGNLKGTWDQPDLSANISGSSIQYNQIFARNFQAEVQWTDSIHNFRAKALSQIKDLKINNTELSGVDVGLNLSAETALAEIKVTHKKGLELTAKGRVDGWRRPSKAITIDTFRLIHETPHPAANRLMAIANSGPIQITLANGAVEVSSCKLLSEAATLSLAGSLSAEGDLKTNLSINELDLKRISSPLQGRDDINGILAADMQISGSLTRPAFQAHVRVSNPSGYDFSLSDLDVWLDYKESRAVLKAAGYHRQNKVLDLNGQAGFRVSLLPFRVTALDNDLNLTLNARNLKLTMLPIPKRPGLDYDGVLNLNVGATGNLTRPLITGSLSLSDGFLNLAEPSLSFKRIAAEVDFSPDKVVIKQLLLNGDKTGTLNVSGAVTIAKMKPTGFNLRVAGENIFVPYRKAVYARVSPDLTLSGTPASPQLSGKLTISEGRINLDLLSDQGPSEIQIEAGASEQAATVTLTEKQTGGSEFIRPLTADIIVDVPKNVWLKGQGVNAEIGGKINLKKVPAKPFILIGSLNTLRGTYDFQNKLFRVTRGKVDFVGLEEPDPNLDIQAETRIKKVKIIVKIFGTARQMTLALDSVPPMDRTDIVSYLVFGRPANDLKGQQGLNAESAVLSMTGQIAAKELKNILGDAFQLDVLTVDSGGEGVSRGAVSIGKYVTPEVFVLYRHRFKADEPDQVEITYEINRNFSLETQLGNEKTTGLDVVLDFDF